MNNYEEINTSKNIFVTNIFEPKDNSLEFELTIGKVDEVEESLVSGGEFIAYGKSIYHDEKCTKYIVTFDWYISFSVLNESFVQLERKEFSGNMIRVYTDSNFLDYIKRDTFATIDHPGEFKHYCFISLNHIINVVSTNEPTIKKIK